MTQRGRGGFHLPAYEGRPHWAVDYDCLVLPRKARRFVGADLAGKSFRDCDLRGADFKKANLQDCDFSGADLSGANFKKANLTGAVLVGANLQRANIWNAVLIDADFSEAFFQGCNLWWKDLDEAEVSMMDSVFWRLPRGSFGGARLRADFSVCSVAPVDFQGAVDSGSKFF